MSLYDRLEMANKKLRDAIEENDPEAVYWKGYWEAVYDIICDKTRENAKEMDT